MNADCPVLAVHVTCALGADTDEVWSQIRERSCGISPMTRFPRDRYATQAAAELPADVVAALTAEDAPSLAYALALNAGTEALSRVTGGAPRVQQARCGLVMSSTRADCDAFDLMALDPSGHMEGHHSPFVLARDVAGALGLNGPVVAVSNACASGLVAIAQAARMLRRGDADMMLVIGVDVLSEFLLAGFSSLAAVSAKPCRPYDSDRDGLSLGEGAGALLLARKAAPTDSVVGFVRGWGVTNDANHITGPSRTGDGLQSAMRAALAMAGADPADVHYINGHGTGTIYNDEMEAKAVHAVFGQNAPPLGSLKGYFGHTLGAAGTIEAALCLVAIQRRMAPSSLGFEQLGVSQQLKVLRDHSPLPAHARVLTAKSGFGGINAAMLLSGEAAL